MDATDVARQTLGDLLARHGAEDAFRPDGVTALDVDGVPTLVTLFEQDGQPWVRLTALGARGVQPTLQLLRDLLAANREVVHGGWQVFEDGTLAFAATLHGAWLSPDTFDAALQRGSEAVAAARSWPSWPEHGPAADDSKEPA